MTPDPQLDKVRLEQMSAQTVDCDNCNITGVPLYEFENDLEPFCAACLIEAWEKWLPNADDWDPE